MYQRYGIKSFALLGLFLSFIAVSGQDLAESGPWKPAARNILHLSAGFGGIYIQGTLSYEYLLRCPDQTCSNQFGIRISYGRWILWGDKGDDLTLMGTWLGGRKNNHLEAGGGILIRYDRGFYQGNYGGTYWRGVHIEDPKRIHCTSLLPAICIGYRYQKPQGGFVFRTGGGWPEALYVGVGIAF